MKNPTTFRIPPVAVRIGERPTEDREGRPVVVPANWPLHFASRPIWGNVTWQSPGPYFWAAQDMSDMPYVAENCLNNARMDARTIVFISEQECFENGQAAVREAYANRPVLEGFEAKFTDPKLRSHFIDKGREYIEKSVNDLLRTMGFLPAEE